MKIAIDARELRTSTGRYVERLLYYLQRTKSEHEYVVLLTPKDMEGWFPTNPQFTKVACPHKEFTFDEQLGFKKQLDEMGADLVHFAMVQQPILYRGTVITTIQDLTTIRFNNPTKNPVVFKAKQQIYKEVIKRAARKSAAIITPTQFVKDDVIGMTKIPATKITVTLESADAILEAPAALPNLQNIDFIMYVGRPTPHKNLERLVDAFALLQKTHPALYLVLAGKRDANYDRIAAKVTTLGLKNVVFTGFVSESELRWLYENCQAYIFPSLSEGFGLPGLEAMVHGAPVVSSNATCLPEINGDAAHYFDPLDTDDIATKIGEVLDNSDLRAQLIKKGRQQVTKYSWQRMAEQTLAVYNTVLG